MFSFLQLTPTFLFPRPSKRRKFNDDVDKDDSNDNEDEDAEESGDEAYGGDDLNVDEAFALKLLQQ
jgi:hypothetical protein